MSENTTLIERERAAHWYYPDGRACHTLPKQDGSGEKNTTLRDARKLGLLPSVTSIISIKSKPALEAWKTEQAILSALTLPRGTEESDDAFAKRVVEDMGAQSKQAAEWGTKIHGECENLHKTGILVQKEDTYPYIKDYERWFKENIRRAIHAETTVTNPRLGYAGRVDLVAELADGRVAVIDLKTQKVKERGPVFYEEWGMQLAAYRSALPNGESMALMSVIIDSGNPAAVASKEWGTPDRYLLAFENCINLWQFDRNYYPTTTPAA